MKAAFRLYRRNCTGVYYLQNNRTREQRSLGTTDKGQAKRILDAKNQEQQTPALNLQLGKAFITNADPKMGTRTWQEAMDELSSHGKQSSQTRCAREFKSPAFDIIRNRPIALTTSEELKAVLKRGGAATNNYLRRLHNLALGNGWIQDGLPERFVLGVEQCERFGFVLRAQTGLFADRRVLAVVNARSAEEDESRFHTNFLNRETSPVSCAFTNASFGEFQ